MKQKGQAHQGLPLHRLGPRSFFSAHPSYLLNESHRRRLPVRHGRFDYPGGFTGLRGGSWRGPRLRAAKTALGAVSR